MVFFLQFYQLDQQQELLVSYVFPEQFDKEALSCTAVLFSVHQEISQGYLSCALSVSGPVYQR